MPVVKMEWFVSKSVSIGGSKMNELTIDEHGRYCGVKIVALFEG